MTKIAKPQLEILLAIANEKRSEDIRRTLHVQEAPGEVSLAATDGTSIAFAGPGEPRIPNLATSMVYSSDLSLKKSLAEAKKVKGADGDDVVSFTYDKLFTLEADIASGACVLSSPNRGLKWETTFQISGGGPDCLTALASLTPMAASAYAIHPTALKAITKLAAVNKSVPIALAQYAAASGVCVAAASVAVPDFGYATVVSMVKPE